MAAALVASTLTFASFAGAATVPQTVTHQGRLFNADNTTFEGTKNVTFRIYDLEKDGVVLFEETISITFTEGYFSASLGETKDLGAALDGSVRYMGITIEGDAEMSPRLPMRSVPYAIKAGDAIGDIHPTTISIGGSVVIDADGKWVGDPTGLVGPKGDTGAAGAVGPTGPAGADGAMGPMGPVGPAGAIGPIGPIGPQGPAGVAGAQGPAGPVGPTGPSGSAATTTLAFDAAWPQTLTAGTPATPTVCRTTAYTPTTPGEVAIFTYHASVLTPVSATPSFLVVGPVGFLNGSTNGQIFGTNNDGDAMHVGAANISGSKRIPLTQGTSYVFGMLAQASVTTTPTAASCNGTVIITKP